MGKSYLKNAALMTGADVLLRLAGMGLRIWLANALGGEGMGLYQLVLAVYSLFVTLATAGVSVAATRLMAEELARSPAEARGMLRRLLLAGAGLGVAALAAQFGLAGLAARWWLGDARAAGALRVSSLGLPWMAVSSVLRGFFIARPHRHRLGRAGPGRRSRMGCRAALYGSAGRNGGQRGRQHRSDGPVLLPGGPPLLRLTACTASP